MLTGRSRAEECTTTIEPDISKPTQTRNRRWRENL